MTSANLVEINIMRFASFVNGKTDTENVRKIDCAVLSWFTLAKKTRRMDWMVVGILRETKKRS